MLPQPSVNHKLAFKENNRWRKKLRLWFSNHQTEFKMLLGFLGSAAYLYKIVFTPFGREKLPPESFLATLLKATDIVALVGFVTAPIAIIRSWSKAPVEEKAELAEEKPSNGEQQRQAAASAAATRASAEKKPAGQAKKKSGNTPVTNKPVTPATKIPAKMFVDEHESGFTEVVGRRKRKKQPSLVASLQEHDKAHKDVSRNSELVSSHKKLAPPPVKKSKPPKNPSNLRASASEFFESKLDARQSPKATDNTHKGTLVPGQAKFFPPLPPGVELRSTLSRDAVTGEPILAVVPAIPVPLPPN